MFGFASVGRQPSSRSSLRARSMRCLDIANRLRYSSSLLPVAAADLRLQIRASPEHCVEDGAIELPAAAVADEQVETCATDRSPWSPVRVGVAQEMHEP